MPQSLGGVFQPFQDQQFGGGLLTDATTSTLGLGYTTGAGGAVTQITSKATAVTLNKLCGQITTHAANILTVTGVSFTLNNNTIAAGDVVNVAIKSGATVNSYLVGVQATATGSCSIIIFNCSTGTLGEALVLNFTVSKAVAA